MVRVDGVRADDGVPHPVGCPGLEFGDGDGVLVAEDAEDHGPSVVVPVVGVVLGRSSVAGRPVAGPGHGLRRYCGFSTGASVYIGVGGVPVDGRPDRMLFASMGLRWERRTNDRWAGHVEGDGRRVALVAYTVADGGDRRYWFAWRRDGSPTGDVLGDFATADVAMTAIDQRG